MNKKGATVLALFLFLSIAATASACELIVYCGITMAKTMTEIAGKFEEKEGCGARIIGLGTGDLIERMTTLQNGDAFLPGSDSYYIKLEKEQPGLIVGEKRLLGYNTAALLVQKGNPKKIPADLKILTDPQYAVVIGNPESGSIGLETKKILETAGIYQEVLKNAKSQTSESKAIVNALKFKQADVTINWRAAAFTPESSPYVDALPIDEQFASKEKLVLSVLRYSSNPEMARKFVDYAGSPEGLAVFSRAGFGD
jgi:molybdate transport system substrate-binding protein